MSVTIKNTDLWPHFLRPHGDRLLIEAIELSDEIETSSGHTIYTAPMNNRDREGKLTEEWKRGFCAGIVLAVGDGHVLTTPDDVQIVTMHTIITDEQIASGVPHLMKYDTETKMAMFAIPTPKRVAMPWTLGDVVLIERLAKREITINGRVFANVDQMDVLDTVANLKYELLSTMEWVRREMVQVQGPELRMPPVPLTIPDELHENGMVDAEEPVA